MSHKHPREPLVRVLLAGAVLSASSSACTKDPQATTNPPPPEHEQPGQPEQDPPTSALPTWASVESDHPPGATSPPMPVLVVNEAGDACYKAWYDPRRVPPEARAKGGVVLDEGEEPSGTQVQCPPEQVAEVLGRHALLRSAEGSEDGD